MKLLAGLLVALFLFSVLPSGVQAWGNPVSSQVNLWNVKKPYTPGWGHCTSCGTCSGSTCDTSNVCNPGDGSCNYNASQGPKYNEQTIQTIGNNVIEALRPTTVIDCRDIGSIGLSTIDCAGSNPFVALQGKSNNYTITIDTRTTWQAKSQPVFYRHLP